MSDSESDEFDPLTHDPRDEEGWEDVDAEEQEQLSFKSLFDDSSFNSLQEMMNYDKGTHGFNVQAVKKQFKLDFLGCIQLVNYVRSETRMGNVIAKVPEAKVFDDEKYLLPVIEDDAVLFSLGELEESEEAVGNDSRLIEQSSGDEIETLKRELAQARDLIAELRLLSRRALEDVDVKPSSSATEANRKEKAMADKIENDSLYFKSYAYNDIHEIMIKDTIRTDAYRDFIYENKDLFIGKTVLDVGCGTGILSMMCAKAGAKRVFAVDNSEIINKARANIFENGLQDSVTCLHGKIEEISLPVKKVDVIVSEWMGYALLYESMLDSVLFARDRYLAPGGLMVPSHTTLFAAPITVPDIVIDKVGFWQDVYGFRMPAMREGVFNEVLLRNLDQEDLLARPAAFLQLPLHSCSVADTIFQSRPFGCEASRDVDALDGFALWFDVFFARSPQVDVPAETQASEWSLGTAFSTGPGKMTTHWMQTVLLIDRIRQHPSPQQVLKNDWMRGKISFSRREANERQIDIDVQWTTNEGTERHQKWELA